MMKRQGGRSILLAPFARAVATAFAFPRTCSHHNVNITLAFSSFTQHFKEFQSRI